MRHACPVMLVESRRVWQVMHKSDLQRMRWRRNAGSLMLRDGFASGDCGRGGKRGRSREISSRICRRGCTLERFVDRYYEFYGLPSVMHSGFCQGSRKKVKILK